MQRFDLAAIDSRALGVVYDVLPNSRRALIGVHAAALGPGAEVGVVVDDGLVELGIVTRHGLGCGKEMALRLDFLNGVGVANFIRPSLRPGAQLGDHVEHFNICDQLLERYAQSALDPACRMDHHARPGHQATPQPHLVLVRRLHVVQVGRRPRR